MNALYTHENSVTLIIITILSMQLLTEFIPTTFLSSVDTKETPDCLD